MGEKFLIDTNILIDAQSKKIPLKGLNYLADIINDHFNVSFVSYIEFLGYKYISSESSDFIALADVIEINRLIIDKCILIRKAFKIKLPDAIIAATAIVNGYTLITNNEKDFLNIKQLKVLNPYRI